MKGLFLFLYRFRAFIIFVFLEIICAFLIIRNNNYQGAAYFNSANVLVASTLEASNNLTNYLDLTRTNNELAEENANLRRQLIKLREKLADESIPVSEVYLTGYEYTPARVINNSTQWQNNYLTLNKGSSEGITPEMGVVSSNGVVGKVKAVSKNFSTVTSFLHSNFYISSKINRTGTLGALYWSGVNSKKAELRHIPRYIELKKGDTIVSSGYSSTFPEGLFLGVITGYSLSEEAAFFDIEVDLSTDFSSLSYVYVVKSRIKEELDSIQTEVIDE